MCVSLPHCHHLWPSIKPLSTLIPASLLLCPCCLVHNTTFFLIVTDVWPSCPHPPACHSGVVKCVCVCVLWCDVMCCDVFYGEEWCVWSGVYLFILFTVWRYIFHVRRLLNHSEGRRKQTPGVLGPSGGSPGLITYTCYSQMEAHTPVHSARVLFLPGVGIEYWLIKLLRRLSFFHSPDGRHLIVTVRCITKSLTFFIKAAPLSFLYGWSN